MTELPIIKFSNELEDAGWVGLAASSLLAIFYLEGTPGAFTSTDSGFVWAKHLGDFASDEEFDFGVGKLKVEGALFTASVGVQLKDGIPSHIDMMFSFLGEGGSSPSMFLEIDSKIAIQADAVHEPLATASDPLNSDFTLRYWIWFWAKLSCHPESWLVQ